MLCRTVCFDSRLQQGKQAHPQKQSKGGLTSTLLGARVILETDMKIKSILSCLSLLLVLFISTAYSQSSSITFQVKLETNLPQGETVCVYLLEREGMGQQTVFPLTNVSNDTWTTTLTFDDGWLAVGVTYHYKYCRNYVYNGADEAVDGNDQGYRKVTIQNENTVLTDTVTQWRWWPVDGQIPEIDTSNYAHTPPADLPDSTFQCGIELPDYWDHPFIYSVEPTLDRIITKCKADYVEYNPVPEVTQFYPTPEINKEGVNGTSDEDLIKIITEAKKRGLKFYLDAYPWAMISDSSPNYHTNEWWIEFEQQWRPIILDYAQISQDYGVDILTFGMWVNRWSVSQQEASIVDSLAQNLLNDVRQIYTGKIAVEFTPWGPDLNLYSEADYLKFNISAFWPYQLSTSKSPTVTEMVTNLNTGLDELYNEGPGKWGKPVILSQIAASSYDGTVINRPDWETQMYYFPNDPGVPLDLQEQADAYEAFLQAFTKREWIKGIYSFNYNYWNSIDKAPSIRSKPAEQVVAKWYHWINPHNLTDVKDNVKLVESFKLYQNYPNPFNPTTNFEFRIANFGFVTLKIYDLLGREVETLVNEEESPGTYEVKFDASQLPSEVYFARMEAGGYVQTIKMLLIK